MIKNNSNNSYKLQALSKIKEENSKYKKDIVELQKQIYKLKKDNRVSESCNCNESAHKLGK
jgi:hypothetical protein